MRCVVEHDRVRAGEDHPTLATSLNNLGMAIAFQWDGSRAAPFLDRATAIRRASFDPPNLPLADSLRCAGFRCFVDGERVRAQPGGYYGGWITQEIFGPFKGEPGCDGL